MRLFFILLIGLFPFYGFGQYDWKLKKNKNGIAVFSSDVAGSTFKAIKVECTLAGTYTRLASILSDIDQFSNWIYHSKSATLVKKNTSTDFIYHTETVLPWPMTNRDAIIHLRVNKDSLPAMLLITGTGMPAHVPKVAGIIRVPYYKATWKVIMPEPKLVHITYIVEVDPGGTIPGWIANMFVEKGPYETFVKLADKMKK